MSNPASIEARSSAERLSNPISEKGGWMLPVASLVLTIFAIVGVWYYLCVALDFNCFRSDTAWYWQDSLNWYQPFNRFHLPGYPLLIALIRTLLLGASSPLFVMRTITVTARILSVWLVYRTILRTNTPKSAFLGAILFSVWPLQGIVTVVHPSAEPLMTCLIVGGVYSWLVRRPNLAGFLWGLALVTHKASWLMVVLLVLVVFFRERKSLSQGFLWLTFAPITLLWVVGSWHYSSFTWIFADSVSDSIQAKAAGGRTLPILDGMLGPLLSSDVKSLMKGVVVWILGGVTLSSLVLLIHRKQTLQRLEGLAICGGVLFLFVVLNRSTILDVVPYSCVLVLPLAWLFGRDSVDRADTSRVLLIGLGLYLVFLASQFAFAWYTAEVFFQGRPPSVPGLY